METFLTCSGHKFLIHSKTNLDGLDDRGSMGLVSKEQK